MFTKVCVILCVSLVFPQLAFSKGSGNQQGNGGFALICENQNDSNCKNSFYDTYEAQVRYFLEPKFDLTIDWSGCGEHAFYPRTSCYGYALDIAASLLKRLEVKDPELYKSLGEYLDMFQYDAIFIDNIVITPTEDMGLGFKPKNQNFVQLVVQHDQHLPEDFRYVISNDDWKLIDPDQQAAAILHEVIYRYALSKNPDIQTSQYVRYFNAQILSDSLRKMSDMRYSEIKNAVFGENFN